MGFGAGGAFGNWPFTLILLSIILEVLAMKFEKNVMFLGSQRLELSDKTPYFQLQLYDPESGPVNINVMGTNTDVLSHFEGLAFGSPLTVTFALRPKDKAYRLVIDHVG